jgi:hypothetical protein
MGLFEGCKEEILVGDIDNDGEPETWKVFRQSCVVQTMLDNGGLEKFGLADDERDNVLGVSVGPWNDVARVDPVQRYAVVTIREGDGPRKFRLMRRKAALALADDILGDE